MSIKNISGVYYDWSYFRKTQGRLYQLSSLQKKEKMKFSIKDFFSKCDQIRGFLWIWSHLLKKSLMENFIFVQWLSVRAWLMIKCKLISPTAAHFQHLPDPLFHLKPEPVSKSCGIPLTSHNLASTLKSQQCFSFNQTYFL